MSNLLPIVCVPGLACSPRLYTEQIPQLWTVGPVTIAQHGRQDNVADIAGGAAFARQQSAIMGRPDSLPSLERIRCQTLVLVGEGDELTPPHLAAEIADGIAGAALVTVPDCGHLSTLERPLLVTQALLELLRGD